MRELIFRGKTKSDKRWVISDSICQKDGKVYLYDEVKDIDVEVDPDTVGQFTGLTDKNGVNVFEGDIIKTADAEVYEVRFRKGCWAGVFCREWEFLTTIAGKSLIVGNKYDDKDLL